MYSSINKDSGCPNQCMADNDYSGVNGGQSCPLECMSNYANPSSTIACPSSCNYYETYSTIGGMYDMYIPASTKARLIPQQSVTDDFMVQNDRITNFGGNVLNVRETSNIESGATTANVLSLMSQLQNVNQQLTASTKSAQDSSKIAQTSSANTAVVLQNQGPASATNNVNIASNAAKGASSDASAATALAGQAAQVADKIAEAVKGLPQTAEVQKAVELAAASKNNAIQMADTANAAAESANAAASAAANTVSGTKEGFHFLRNRGVVDRFKQLAGEHSQKAVIHNRLRYRRRQDQPFTPI